MSIQNVTKFKIDRPAQELFEAFTDPAKIGNFWFSSSSARWEQGKTITVTYNEYNAKFDIRIAEIKPNKRIVLKWGESWEENTVVISFDEIDAEKTCIEVSETGWSENDPSLTAKLVDNKEGWVYMLACLKAYLENGVTTLRTGLIQG